MGLDATVLCLFAMCSVASAEATFTFLKTVNVAELNGILAGERDKFL